jgi:hypothetical protein
MAVVNATLSDTLNGAAVADALAGGGSGVDLGQVAANGYAPLINKTANTGARDLYLRHDAVTDPITSCGIYVQNFGVGTAFAYGGADSAANDYTNLISIGASSGTSKNNSDGLSAGIWIDFDWDVSDVNQFNISGRPTEVFTIGKSNAGIDLANNIQIATVAMVYDSGGETAAVTPVAGQIGISGDSVLGDNAHMKQRIYIPNTFLGTGIMQIEEVFTYAFTS